MIKNEKQLKITTRWLKEFTKSLKELSKTKHPDVHPIIAQAEIDGIKSKIADFKKDIREYKRTKIRVRTPIKSIYDLGDMLIKARIMNHLTQKQLADKIGVAEQQIQRYEETDYQNASLHRIFEIAKELNISSTTFTISIKTTE